MALQIFNTLSGKKEPFQPLRPNKVGMYVCGVTVYDLCHVGHARSAVVFDVIYRYLKYLGYEVEYVRNFTDIDDKIIKRAQEENTPWQEVTEKYIQAFYEDMGQLNIAAPTVEPKATQHLKEMVSMIASLVEQNKAYESDGDVFYSVKTFEGYGRLSGKNTEDLIAGARVEVNEKKRDPMDFALWKKSKPGEPAWDTPWGKGRPGWHIECSAMGRRYLGDTFDIHGGGKDLVFPHHENEIAQSCGVTGKQPVNVWIHNGFVNIDKEKMSKSLGNFFTLRDIYKIHHPETLRWFLMSSHYRSPIDFSRKSLEDAEKVVTRFFEAIAGAEEAIGSRKVEGLPDFDKKVNESPLVKKFKEAMNDDFNSPVAVAHLNEGLRALNKALTIHESDPEQWEEVALGLAALRKTADVLGLFSRAPWRFQKEMFDLKNRSLRLDTEKIEALIVKRTEARKAKDWSLADVCRDELAGMGVAIEDSPEGTKWKVR